MIDVKAELALRIRQSRLWDVTRRQDTPPQGLFDPVDKDRASDQLTPSYGLS